MSLREPLARGSTFRRLIVEQLGVAWRSTTLGQRTHRHEPFVGTHAHSHLVADVQLLSGFRARPVHVHLASGDGIRRERPGFEESRGPKPAIEAYGCRLSVER
jgi:hypothetical protein